MSAVIRERTDINDIEVYIVNTSTNYSVRGNYIVIEISTTLGDDYFKTEERGSFCLYPEEELILTRHLEEKSTVDARIINQFRVPI